MKRASVVDAVVRGDVAQARALLDEFPDELDARSGSGVSLVLLCRYHGHTGLAQWIAERRARPLDVCEAAALGDVARLQALLDGDAALAHARSADGFGALGLATFFAQPACARALLDAGAPVDEPAANATRVTPLHSAAAARQHEIAGWLVERGADVNARQQGGFTPLHAAAQNGDLLLTRLLLLHGASRDALTDGGASPSDLARAADHREVRECLQANGS